MGLIAHRLGTACNGARLRALDEKEIDMKYIKKARTLLRIHGVCLILLGVGNAIVSYLATNTEIQGPLHFLYKNPIAEAGFLQAYLLCGLVGVTLIIGSRYQNFVAFDVIGITMHLIPPASLLLMYEQVHAIIGTSTIWPSIAIHTTFAALELAAIWLYQKGTKLNAV